MGPQDETSRFDASSERTDAPACLADAGASDGGADQGDSKRRCTVCKGLATGYHYGVASCEACKAFFKRTVQKKLSYTCLEKRQCSVLYGKKRTCQACRYEKCIEAGMMVNGVRQNRSKGGRQEYRRRPDERDFSPATSGKKRKHKLALEFSERLLEIEPEVLRVHVPDDMKTCFNSGSRDKTKQVPGMMIMADLADRALITTVRWAKKIPGMSMDNPSIKDMCSVLFFTKILLQHPISGFDKLCLNDQMALLCSSWMEILLMNVIHRNSLLPAAEACGGIVFAPGLVVYREDMNSPERSVSPLIFEQIVNLVDRIRPLKLSKAIVVILKAMVLFNAGPSLSNRLLMKSHKELEEIQSTVQDALHYRIQQEHPGNKRLVYHLMMLLPLVKETALTVSSLVWSAFDRERVPMQQLLKEVLQPILQTSERNQRKMPRYSADATSTLPEQPNDDRVKTEHTQNASKPAFGYPT
ncbi:steroid hormone receptor ERR1-like [Patiria miniata]|uniref:Estrogen receptor n=1 Tax=Patiria miniata TaxID=46514 RepID=A0A914ATR8_PATMI|nr:steroid hormone receptor ERR1-like [Patiria miniata]